MKFEFVSKLSDEEFRRLVGIKRDTYNEIVIFLKNRIAEKLKFGGKKHKLSVENQTLLTFEYLREYRTFFHISKSYQIAESTTYRIFKWVSSEIYKNFELDDFRKKNSKLSDNEFGILIVDATESPIERPKTEQKKFYSGKKNDIL